MSKVERWAQQFAAGSVDSQGTVVLFVTVGDQFPKHDDNGLVHRQARNAIVRGVRKFPGARLNPTAARFFHVGWHELFPAEYMVCDDFVSLPVSSPTGLLRSGVRDVWEGTFLFDDVLVPFDSLHEDDAVFDVVGSGRLLDGVPWWLRDGVRDVIAFDAVRGLWPEGLPGFSREDLAGNGFIPSAALPERVRA